MTDLVLRNDNTVKPQEAVDPSQLLHLCSMPKANTAEERPLTPFGERIMKAATEAGFTATSLGRAAKFSSGYMTRILYRTQNRMDLAYFKTLCELLSVRMEWLAFNREPMRDGGPRPPVEEAIIDARRLGVTEDVFWYVRKRDAAEKTRDEAQWLEAFLDEHRKRRESATYAKDAKRVPMQEKAVEAPASSKRSGRAKSA